MGLQIIWIFVFFVIHNFSNNTNLRRNPIFIMLLCYTLHTWCFSNYTTDNMSPVASMTIPPTLCSTVYTASHAMLHSPFSSPCCLCYVLLPFLCHHSFLCCYLQYYLQVWLLLLGCRSCTHLLVFLLHLFIDTSQTNEDEMRLQQHGATMEKVCSLKQPQLLSP